MQKYKTKLSFTKKKKKKKERLFFQRQTGFVRGHCISKVCVEKLKLMGTACDKTVYPRAK